MKVQTARTASFGPYEIDLRSGELRKCGIKVKMGEQPFQILLMLITAPGGVVTREELRARLWAGDTFVDFDHGLNSAVQRLRDCLSDTAAKPQWIETVPRRGYRFVGQVEWTNGESSSENGAAIEAEDSGAPLRPQDLAPPVLPGLENGKSTGLKGQFLILGVAIFVLLLSIVIQFAKRRNPQSTEQALTIRSIAVLPLENLSGDPGQEHFADGMTDELITMLAKNPYLQITSRTSVMQYKKVHRPLRDIARELHVDAICEGSISRTGDRLHATIKLIRAATDAHIWAESYDRNLSDADSLGNEVAQTIATQIGVPASITHKPEKRIGQEAHDAYLLGRYYWFTSDNRSQDYFQKAIDLQPDYSAAWSGLADFYLGAGVQGKFPPEIVMPKGKAAAQRAVLLDDSVPEAHNSMAAAYFFYDWNWDAADKESWRSVELNPSFAEARHLRAYVLEALNRPDEALREQKKCIELDPFARPWALTVELIRQRRFKEALDDAKARSEAQPSDPTLHFILRSAYFYNGLEEEAAQEWERGLLLSGARGAASAVRNYFKSGGYKAIIEWDLANLKKRAAKEYVSPLDIADDYALLKRKEETIRYIERSYQERVPHMVYIQNMPNLDFVHSDPRYQAIVTKMKLPAAF